DGTYFIRKNVGEKAIFSFVHVLHERPIGLAEGRYLNVRKDYSPDKQKKATETVLEQAELICKDWAEA
ncbi:hypothetical protein KA005_78225, partial [bacterium]|nr:hypothetical protein [bacterium]